MGRKNIRKVYKVDNWGNHYQRIEILLVCEFCESDFWGRKVSQKFCSTLCRVKSHRNQLKN